ncbi:MAG: CxxxxCH/CxxCH domain-containing protein [Desulfuromonadales bacterium]|nr:CxxxxCH/CxxCH domain-containing protein [Desulfuromonadales bacterium]
MARPWGLLVRSILIVITLLACLIPDSLIAETAVHTFDCKNCHIPSLSVEQLGGGNVCLSCHDDTLNLALGDSSTGSTNTAFSLLDASNASGYNPGFIPGKGQTSHNWGAPDTQPSVGASAPSRTLYPQFYSRFGSSQGKVTCSRCHNPHADRTNPQLLIMGPGSAQQMCLACHVTWNQGSGMSNLTHPVNIDYTASAAAHPGKYATAPSEDDGDLHNADQISLFNGKILCGSCHQVHFADSDANTADIPANFAALSSNGGDGFILRANGPKRADKSGLCKTCHTYQAHGDASGEKVGCMVCHGGHASDSALPNYFMLRKDAVTTTYGATEGLDYSSPSVLDGGLKYTFWNDRNDGSADGYCEKCHGDAKTIGIGAGEYHTATAVCTDCHSHGQTGGAFAASCNACHGMPPVAGTTGPGGLVGSPGPTGSTSPGAHAVHATTKQYPCGSCHANSVGSGSTHNDGEPQSITLGFSLFGDTYRGGTYNGQSGVSYDASQANTTVTTTGAKTCTNVYCHGGTMAANGGTNLNPTWDNPTTGTCGKCHGATATNPPLRGSHRTHVMSDTWYYDTRSNPPNPYIYGQNLACTTCHSTNAAAHVNGQADWSFNVSGDPRLTGATYKDSSAGVSATVPGVYGQCANLYCHSIAQTSTGGPLTGLPGEYQTPTWGALAEGTCGSCHNADQGHAWFANRGSYGNWAPYITSGSHAKHLQSLAGPDPVGMGECAVCHNYVGSDSLNGCASVCHNRDILHVNHEIDVLFPPTLYGATAAYDGTKAPGDGYGACAATYCHGNYPGSGRNATPSWGDAGTAACGSCHGGSNSDYPVSGSHRTHAIAGGYNIACAACHSGTVSGTGPYTMTGQAKHANGKIDWAFNTLDSRLRGGAEIYNVATGSAPPSDGTTPRAYSSCTYIYCHSNAQPDGGVGNPDDYASPVWGVSSTGLGCGACHQSGIHGDEGPVISSGSHAAHLAGNTSGVIKCMTCHRYDSTLSGATNGCKNCHPGHTPVFLPPPRTLFDNHVNGRVTINIDPIFGSSSSYNGTPAPGDGYGTCANISCHGSGTPQWGGTVACGDCHALPPASGAHLAHTNGTGAAYGSDSNLSTPTSQGFNCGNCHALDGSKHGNGVVEIELYNAAATGFKQNNPADAGRTGTGTATVCSNIYCHSSGQVATVRTYASTPQWGGTFSGNRCAGCHGDPPAYANGGVGSASANSHYASQLSWDRPVEGGHLVGLHFDNIKKIPPDGPGGLYSKGGGIGSGAGHGDPATSTTISCPTCHAATVTVAGQYSAQGTGFACTPCHTNPVAGSIANRANHVNGTRDVAFMSGTFRTRAQLKPAADFAVWPDPEPEPGPFTNVIEPLGWTRNNGYKTANNSHDSVPFSGTYNAAAKSCTTVCHLSQPATWGDTSKGCFACHADL